MALNLSVGYLADLAENDSEGAERVRADFARLNAFLRKEGLAAHTEPENIQPFSCDMWGYSGLHYLRRVAAHLARDKRLPPPGDDNASDDPLLAARYAAEPGRGSLLSRVFGRTRQPQPPPFEHLIQHSDAEGYYLPQDFAAVLTPAAEWKIPGGEIGSSHRLLAECETLARALELPLDLDIESEEVYLAPESQGNSDVRWKRYGVESFTCLRLRAAALHSIEAKAALVFC